MSSTQDDAFREIQLSGKQLVFIFMAVVVIGVSVFLMGVMVGRGVLAAKGTAGADSTAAVNEAEVPPPASASAGSTSTPSTVGEKLSYAERLNAAEPQKESLKPDAEPPAEAPSPKAEVPATPEPSPAPAAAKTPEPTPAPKAAAVAPKPEPPKAEPPKPEPVKPEPKATAKPSATAAPAATAATAATEPAGNGFAIQVAALKESGEADAIVKKLAAKGYPAYVVTPQKGAPSMYRVRVGKYKDRREADTVAARLQKEEQFKPWIVR